MGAWLLPGEALVSSRGVRAEWAAAGGAGRAEAERGQAAEPGGELAGTHVCVCLGDRLYREKSEPGFCQEGPDALASVGQESSGQVCPLPQGLL